MQNESNKHEVAIHPLMKVYVGYEPDTPDEVVREFWKNEFPELIEKPCVVLEWCPYGPIVEQFPLPGGTLAPYDPIADPEPCAVFGHYCPVYFSAEPFVDVPAMQNECLCDECRAKAESTAKGKQATADGDIDEVPDRE